ncbi:MAG: glutathione S-transferase family protein [Pseudomonadota bacterium]
MVKLLDSDIRTREVLDWTGVHLLHFMGSSCSQKTRIFLNLKGIDWTSRHVDVPAHENYGDWYMGINPRGLVPVLVHDGQVIIESNDILEHLEAAFPDPKLIPAGKEKLVHELLAHEDDLHLDLRALSMRYVFGPGAGQRDEAVLNQYENAGSGTVAGERDPHKEVELKFFKDLASNGGVSDEQVRGAAGRFKAAFTELDTRLASGAFLLGEALSVLDIAWYIYAVRLSDAGYPIHAEHPRLGAWFDRLNVRPEFAREVQAPPPFVERRKAFQAEQSARGESLVQIAGLKGA